MEVKNTIELTEELQEQIINKIKEHVKSTDFAKFEQDNPTVAEQIKQITKKDLSLGCCPILDEAYVEGDYTAEGFCYLTSRGKTVYSKLDLMGEDYKMYTYTLASSFSTNRLAFISSSNKADKITCKIAAKMYQYDNVYEYSDASTIAEQLAKSCAETELNRLNYKLKECRVNNYNRNYESTENVIPIYPIYVTLKDKKGNAYKTVIGSCTLGYKGRVYEKPYIETNIAGLIVDQQINNKTSKAVKKGKVRGWIFGIIGILVVLAGLGSCIGSCV